MAARVDRCACHASGSLVDVNALTGLWAHNDCLLNSSADEISVSQMLEKAIGKELFKLKEKQEGAVMQTVIAKMQYAQSKQHALLDKNKALSRMLQHETKMRRSKSSLGRSHPHTGNLRRSKTAMGDASMERSGMLPPVQGIRGGDQAWGDPSERASKKQALGRTR